MTANILRVFPRRTAARVKDYQVLPDSKRHSAAKRATMDLTRELAEWKRTYTITGDAK